MQKNNFLLYKDDNNNIRVDVLLKDETIWLTINQMAELFGVNKSSISRHIRNIFEASELQEEVVVAKIATTTQHGAMQGKTQTKSVMYFNLDMIISVGYRVNSIRGAQFRIWATNQLKELIIKGFVLDKEKLKNPDRVFGEDYFDELLEEIRDIRSSEKRFYRKITDIYALSVDYNPSDEETQNFFKVVQNKLIYSATGKTAPELIVSRVNAKKPNMGLTSWEGNKVRKKDITISKNYLTKDELDILNRIVTMYLDYAEMQAKQRKQMFMKDWREKLDAFLQFNGQEILQDAGTVTAQIAQTLATEQYIIFNENRRLQNSKKDSWDELKALENKS